MRMTPSFSHLFEERTLPSETNISSKFPKFLLNLGVCVLWDLLIVLDSTNRALQVCNLWTIIIFLLLCWAIISFILPINYGF